MATEEVATLLVDMCRRGEVEEAKEKLFTEDIISIEPADGILPEKTTSMDAIKKKGELFISMVEIFMAAPYLTP